MVIQGAGPLLGYVGVDGRSLEPSNIKEVVKLDLIASHVICPFQYLRMDVNKEGIARPAAYNHNPLFWVEHEEEAHSCTCL
jgi:hypothetical protein